MLLAPKPEFEKERIESLERLNILDTPIEERFERITRLVCCMLNVPISNFTLIDQNRQWFKSSQGMDGTEGERDTAFCAHTILEEDMLVIPDATKDTRFADNPFVTGLPHVGFYAGVPVHAPTGEKIGSLCAVDVKPREISNEQINALKDLAAMVEIELRNDSLARTHDELVKALSKAERLAMIDPLTRIWNRSGIWEIIRREWAEATRQKKPVTLVMCDVDHFKKVNDTYGHGVGDTVLRTLSRKIMSGIRAEDGVGRFGGEEFLLVMPGAEKEKAAETLNRLRKSIEHNPVQTASGPVPVTMSFGAVSVVPNSGLSPEDVIQTADELLYNAKDFGRNRVEMA